MTAMDAFYIANLQSYEILCNILQYYATIIIQSIDKQIKFPVDMLGLWHTMFFPNRAAVFCFNVISPLEKRTQGPGRGVPDRLSEDKLKIRSPIPFGDEFSGSHLLAILEHTGQMSYIAYRMCLEK